MSYNGWLYTYGNPVNNVDPTGYKPRNPPDPKSVCWYSAAAGAAYVDENLRVSKSDWLNTYAAAGMAVQCWINTADPTRSYADGTGPGQVSDEALSTEWGKRLDSSDDAFGLLCFIVKHINEVAGESVVSCTTICDDKAKLIAQYGAENVTAETPLDQTTMAGAVEAMRRRIKQVLYSCHNCTNTDRFIAAALAQDAQLSYKVMDRISDPTNKNSYRYLPEANGLYINWKRYFSKERPGTVNWFNTYYQVRRFNAAVSLLRNRGWSVPGDLHQDTIDGF